MCRTKLYNWLDNRRLRFLQWQNDHLPGSVVLIFIALILGVLTGSIAAVLKRLVGLLNDLVLSGYHSGELDYKLLIWPVVGILLTSIFQRYVVGRNISQGTKIIRETINSGNPRMKPFTAFNSVIGCALTMGFGASGGTEGPTGLAGSAIAGGVSRWFRLPQKWQMLMLAIGAGAGISAIFKSPMGGVLFTLEVLQMRLSSLSVLALIIACLFASSTAYALSDFTFDIEFWRQMPIDPSSLGWVALLGFFCGLYSIYYNYTKNRSQSLFMKIKNPWLGALATGVVLSVSIFLFPALFGEGFQVIESMVNGSHYTIAEQGILSRFHGTHLIVIGIGAVLLLKGILVAASYSNGGVSGDFVPTFFAGALAGFLFGICCNDWFGVDIPIWYFALIGMGCVMAGTVHAPLMSIFILCETTNTYGYIFAYIIAISVSYATVKIIMPKSWYLGTDHDDIMALMDADKDLSIKSKV